MRLLKGRSVLPLKCSKALSTDDLVMEKRHTRAMVYVGQVVVTLASVVYGIK